MNLKIPQRNFKINKTLTYVSRYKTSHNRFHIEDIMFFYFFLFPLSISGDKKGISLAKDKAENFFLHQNRLNFSFSNRFLNAPAFPELSQNF